MKLGKIDLQNFRSFAKGEFELESDITVVLGPNGAGKTNLLEAIYMMATGKSFRAEEQGEVIRYGESFARISGQIQVPSHKSQVTNDQANDSSINKLVILLTNGSEGMTRKKFLVNGVARRMIDFVGNFRAILFGPQDMELLTGSPSKRRDYLDGVLVQVDMEYRRALLSYERGLRQRNRVLEAIREGQASRSQLLFWDRLVIKNGNLITDKRAEYVEYLNTRLKTQDSRLNDNFRCEYDRSEISPARLAQYEREEVAAAATLVGPHRDDFKVTKTQNSTKTQNGERRDVATFGSRGEQRMGVLWLKMGELAFVESKTGTRAVLLLDDIFSELDHTHRDIVISEIGGQQTILTSADEHLIGEDLMMKATIMRLNS